MADDVKTIIRYDGPALIGHEIDVQELAPALLALADMVQFANRKFNGDTATMRVTVKADVKQRCFQLQIHIIQSLLESARHLFGTAEYKTAKEIAEILDLVLPGGLTGGVIWLWKKLADRQRELAEGSQTKLEAEQRGGLTVINNFYGDGNSLTVNTDVYQLASDPEMQELGKRTLAPLEQPGYETLAFYESDNPDTPVIEVSKDEANAFIALPPLEGNEESLEVDDEQRTPIRSVVFVKTQRNEGKADWEIKWAARAEWASIDDLPWLERFQAGEVQHDLPLYLDVEMVMVTSRTNPDARPRFSVEKVLGVVPNGGGKQTGMFNGDPA